MKKEPITINEFGQIFKNEALMDATLTVILSIVSIVSFAIHPLLSIIPLMIEGKLVYGMSKKFDQRNRIGKIFEDLSRKEGNITRAAIQIYQAKEEIDKTRKEIGEIKEKIFDAFNSSGFNTIEKRIGKLEKEME